MRINDSQNGPTADRRMAIVMNVAGILDGIQSLLTVGASRQRSSTEALLDVMRQPGSATLIVPHLELKVDLVERLAGKRLMCLSQSPGDSPSATAEHDIVALAQGPSALHAVSAAHSGPILFDLSAVGYITNGAMHAIMALQAMLHDVAAAGAATQAERDEYSSMLRDFSGWSSQVQALMSEAADVLDGVVEPGKSRDLVKRLREAVMRVKTADDLEHELDDEMIAKMVVDKGQ